ncbi:c-type cytochrome [Algirhabdus cladophorae]|uniref:c-type cytochrome n=1 Tax=Algirhabdus cladophorae TaxID=3377108 RepID=UPI003B847DCE
MWRALAIALCAATPLAAQEFFTLKGHGGPIMDVAVAPSGQIATASFDNSVGLWQDTVPLWLEGHAAAVISLAFWSNDILVSGGDDFAVHLWGRGGEGRALGKHKGKVTALATCQGNTGLIASASWDGSIGIWDVGTSVKALLGNHPAVIPSFLTGHSSGVNDVAFSPDCGTLYSASSDGTIRIWDVAQGSQKRQLVKHGFGVNKLVLNTSEGWLAYGAVDGGTRIVNLETGREIADFTLDRRPILSMDFDAAHNRLAVGDGEGFIMLIDTAAMKIAQDFRATQRGPIWALAFSEDGQNIHAGGIEDTMYSWPVATIRGHGQMSGTQRSFLEDPNTLSNGERQFKRKCSICHALTPSSARKAGPTLYQLFGRKAGAVTDYAYSNILTGSDIIWSAQTINGLFDLGPDHYIPGTKMPMQRIVKQADRDDLIDYLRRATAPGGEPE